MKRRIHTATWWRPPKKFLTLIVFSLWWLFFTLISDRHCKKGFVVSSLMELVYIPTLMSLGMIAVAFSRIFEGFEHANEHTAWIKSSFGLSLGLFLLGINTLLFFLEYPLSIAA